jgi:hypothetical protein
LSISRKSAASQWSSPRTCLPRFIFGRSGPSNTNTGINGSLKRRLQRENRATSSGLSVHPWRAQALHIHPLQTKLKEVDGPRHILPGINANPKSASCCRIAGKPSHCEIMEGDLLFNRFKFLEPILVTAEGELLCAYLPQTRDPHRECRERERSVGNSSLDGRSRLDRWAADTERPRVGLREVSGTL